MQQDREVSPYYDLDSGKVQEALTTKH